MMIRCCASKHNLADICRPSAETKRESYDCDLRSRYRLGVNGE